ELGPEAGGRLLVGDRLGVVDDAAAAAQFRLEGQHEIVHDGVVGDGGVQRAADGVDAAVGPEQAAQAPLALLQEGLVFPVQPVGVAAGGGVHQDEAAADDADRRVPE